MTEPGNKSVRVLLVDDEEDLVEFLTHRLVKRGFTVTATTAGADALVASARQRYDVAIVDLKMPGMDGIAVLEQLKDHQPYLEAIILTGHGSHATALAAGRLQAFRYLLKPYEFDELVTLIEEAATAKRETMVREFQAAQAKIIAQGGTAREISEASDRLRREYEQD
ncbi:MAG: response regulator [bacterium]